MDSSALILNVLYGLFTLCIWAEFFYDRKAKRGLYSARDSWQTIYLLIFFSVIFYSTKYALLFLEPHFAGCTLPIRSMSIMDWAILTVGYDFLYYWIHRLEHGSSFVWGSSHIHHHSSRYLNLLTGFRSSVFQPLYSLPFYIPLYLIGFRTNEIFLMVVLNKLYNFWVHQQHLGKLGFIDQLFNSPSNHRVHHGRNPQYIDKNLGGIFILWDKWFGTYEPEVEKVQFGVKVDPEQLTAAEVMTMGLKKTH